MEDDSDVSDDSAARPGPVPWYRRALPVAAIAVVVVAVAALLLPSVRHQLGLSVTHRPERYLELSFPQSPDSGRLIPCDRFQGRARVGFVVVSHLEHPEAVRYQFVLRPDSGKGARVLTGSTYLTPGEPRTVVRAVPLPHVRYVLTVTLPGNGERLRAHCPVTSAS